LALKAAPRADPEGLLQAGVPTSVLPFPLGTIAYGNALVYT